MKQTSGILSTSNQTSKVQEVPFYRKSIYKTSMVRQEDSPQQESTLRPAVTSRTENSSEFFILDLKERIGFYLLTLQSETGMVRPMPPRLGQYLGEVFPSSRVAQYSGVGFSGGGVGQSVPPVRAMTAAEPTVARAETRTVLASIMIVCWWN